MFDDIKKEIDDTLDHLNPFEKRTPDSANSIIVADLIEQKNNELIGTAGKNEIKDYNEVKEENRLITKGIEVGHIFYFGDKYSKALNASVDLPGGKKDFVKMGNSDQNYLAARNDDNAQQIKAIDKLNEKSGLFILSRRTCGLKFRGRGRVS